MISLPAENSLARPENPMRSWDRGPGLSELNDPLCRLEGDEYTKTKKCQLYFVLDITTVRTMISMTALIPLTPLSLFFFSSYPWFLALWSQCHFSLALLCAFHRFSRCPLYSLFPICFKVILSRFSRTLHNLGPILSPSAPAIPSFLGSASMHLLLL